MLKPMREIQMLPTLWPAVVMPSTAQMAAPQLATLSEAEWLWMIRQAQRHGLAPLLYAAVKPLGLPADPASAAGQTLHTIYRQATLLGLQRTAELKRLLAALATVEICPAVFKGAALAHTLYPSPACRPMGDIDLWVSHAEMPAAIAALESLGYQMREKERRPHALTQSTDGEVQMLAGQPGQGLVELHWGVFPGEWLAHTTEVDREGVRQRLVQTLLVDQPARLLAPEDALIQLAVHVGVNHQMSTNALRSLVDIALLANQGIDWAALCQRARRWRVATAVGFTLDLVDRLFGLPSEAAPARRMAPQGLQRQILAQFATPTAILQGRNIAADPRRFLYLLALADRPVDSLRLLIHAVWPSNVWLAARYGRGGWQIRLRHATRAVVGEI
jgi:hypothetical protein